ncbi:MAG: hypothetical protein AB7V16_07435 [Vulcanibacillus sp.]
MSNFQSSYNRDKSILYKDSPIVKKIDRNGNIIELINSDAISQAFRTWVVSGKGEKLRSNSGGWLLSIIGKEVTEEKASQIEKNIVLGAQVDFEPPMTITYIAVIPDKKNFKYVIKVEGYNASVNVGINTYAVIDAS